jgi:hypothetical protein
MVLFCLLLVSSYSKTGSSANEGLPLRLVGAFGWLTLRHTHHAER